MKTEDWNPGHSLNKGYPYAGIESRVQLPNRVRLFLEEDNVITMMYGNFSEPQNTTDSQIEFLMSRCFDFQEALTTAEQQLAEILEDDPFLPEDLGFELVHKPEKIYDSPIRVYSSKYDPRFTLHREIVDVHDENLDTTKWVVMKKHADSDDFDKIEVKIPCHRIAYALFSALGVIMEGEKEEVSIPVISERPLANPEE